MERSSGVDDGAAVVDFVLVSVLVVLLFALVLQVGLTLHTRNTLVALAAEGARYGADADVDSPAEVEARTRAALAGAFSPSYAARATIVPTLTGQVVEVRITAPVPLLLLAGPVQLTVAGHALEESR